MQTPWEATNRVISLSSNTLSLPQDWNSPRLEVWYVKNLVEIFNQTNFNKKIKCCIKAIEVSFGSGDIKYCVDCIYVWLLSISKDSLTLQLTPLFLIVNSRKERSLSCKEVSINQWKHKECSLLIHALGKLDKNFVLADHNHNPKILANSVWIDNIVFSSQEPFFKSPHPH